MKDDNDNDSDNDNKNDYLVREHLVSDRASHIFKYLQYSAHCRALCLAYRSFFLDHASTGFQLKIKRLFIFKEKNHP